MRVLNEKAAVLAIACIRYGLAPADIAESGIANIIAAEGLPYIGAELVSLRRMAAMIMSAELAANRLVTVPANHVIEGVSTLANNQWIKTKRVRDSEDFATDIVKAFEEARLISYAEEEGLEASEAEVDVLLQGDAHFGMLVSSANAQSDYNLNIASEMHRSATTRLAGKAKAELCVFVDLGDSIHADDNTQLTARSKHKLDVDSRWEKVFEEACATKWRQIDILLKVYEHVHVIVTPGNHAPHSEWGMIVATKAYFRDNECVSVDVSRKSKKVFAAHDTALVFRHGHTSTSAKAAGTLNHDFPSLMRGTKRFHMYEGHVHHRSIKPLDGGQVQTCATLCPNDTYSNDADFRGEHLMELAHYSRSGYDGSSMVRAEDL